MPLTMEIDIPTDEWNKKTPEEKERIAGMCATGKVMGSSGVREASVFIARNFWNLLKEMEKNLNLTIWYFFTLVGLLVSSKNHTLSKHIFLKRKSEKKINTLVVFALLLVNWYLQNTIFYSKSDYR